MDILVVDTRGDVEDLIHPGIITVVDYKGNILYGVGDHNKVVFSRSSAKPIQAISVVESKALEEYEIDERELSQMCASHAGEEFHENCVKKILEKAGLDESYLKCGFHLPFNKKRAEEFLKNNITPTEVHSNCSGKHSGMLITAKKLGYSLDDYYLLDHPIQQKILENFALICDAKKEDIKIGIDGCGVPVHALPMYNLAYGYARLAKPEGIFSEEKTDAINKITKAMTTYPEMIAGTDRICTDLMKSFGDRLFAKGGANAYYSIGIKNRGIGIAIKMLDGSSNNLPLVIFETLIELGVIDRKEMEDFNKVHTDFNVYNHRKEIVGNKKFNIDFKKYKYVYEN